MEEERMELYVDSEDTYIELENIYYIHPKRLGQVRCLSDNQFNSCKIKNSSVECLTSMNFNFILRKLKPKAKCQIVILQPISVMQEYDARQVEANARLAGFTNIEVVEFENVDSKTNKKSKTLAVNCVKPLKNEMIEVEIERRSSLKFIPRTSLSGESRTYNLARGSVSNN